MNTSPVNYLLHHGVVKPIPFNPAPFIYMENGKPKCGLAEFGLRPFWAKDKRFGTKTYNARSETVHEKPSYKIFGATPKIL